MSEEAGFVAALAAVPDDETAALAFSDWLQERSDPRAPMLRAAEVRAWMHPKYENPLPGLVQALESGKKITQASKVLALVGAPAVPHLVALFAHKETTVQLRALKVLRLMISHAGAAMPALLALSKSTDYAVRGEAHAVAMEIAQRGAADVAPLQAALHDPDADVRRWAAAALSAMRATGEVKSDLAKGLSSDDEAERLAALGAMSNLHGTAATAELSKALADPSAEVRRAAAKQLSHAADARTTKLVEPLRRALADPDPEVRRLAVSALANIGPGAAGALPELLQLLADADPKERGALVSAVGRVGAGDPRALDEALATLADPGESVRSEAVAALARWPALPPSVAPALLAFLRGFQNTYWRHDVRQALVALAKLDPMPDEVRDDFRARLAGNWGPTIASVLGEIGPPAAPLLPELIAQFRPGQVSVRVVGLALGKIGGDGVAALVAALGAPAPASGNNALADAAVEGLQAAGPAALSALPALLARLRQPLSPTESWALPRALKALGPGAATAAPELVELFVAEQDGPHGLSEVLAAFGPAIMPFVPRLVEALDRPALAARHTSVLRLLADLIPHGADALPAFRAALQRANRGEWYAGNADQRLYVARSAIDGLAAVGPGAAAALPELEVAYRTFAALPPGDARENVLDAYGKIGAEMAPAIRAALADSSWRIRGAAVWALGDTGDASQDTVDALRKLETDASSKVRARAAAVLKKLDAPAKKKRKK